MTIRKQPSGKWYAVLKSGRAYVAGRTFDTKREAQAWLVRERSSLAGGIDPRAGRETVRRLLSVWLEERQHSVSARLQVGCCVAAPCASVAGGDAGRGGVRSE